MSTNENNTTSQQVRWLAGGARRQSARHVAYTMPAHDSPLLVITRQARVHTCKRLRNQMDCSGND